jgi:competence protein ComFB
VSLKNYMEDVVSEVYREYLQKEPSFCRCERCAQDVQALALTHLRGKYAVSKEGEIFAKISRDDRQVRADALVAIIKAAEAVQKHPNH